MCCRVVCAGLYKVEFHVVPPLSPCMRRGLCLDGSAAKTQVYEASCYKGFGQLWHGIENKLSPNNKKAFFTLKVLKKANTCNPCPLKKKKNSHWSIWSITLHSVLLGQGQEGALKMLSPP